VRRLLDEALRSAHHAIAGGRGGHSRLSKRYGCAQSRPRRRLDKEQLPPHRVLLVQLRLTPHMEGASEVMLFKMSVLVGEAGKVPPPSTLGSTLVPMSVMRCAILPACAKKMDESDRNLAHPQGPPAVPVGR
jgi:hypothetical protein